MTPRDLVVFVEGAAGRDSRLAYAAEIARQWHAHLIATFVPPRIGMNRHASYAVGGGLTDVLDRHRRDVEQAREDAARAFRKAVAHDGLTSEWRVARDPFGEELMLHARHASLAILGPPARSADAYTMLSLAEEVIFASGRPGIMVPIDWPARGLPERVVIGWNAGREATRAIAGAMPFLTAAQAVHLVVVPEARVQEAYGANPGADIARHLARHKVTVELEQHEGTDAGAVLLERCRALSADMLVMGAVGRSKISEFVVGSATRAVFAAAPLPILLAA